MKKFGISIALILLLGVIMATGCSAPVAKNGDTVQVNYTGKLEDGSTFDTSIGKEPLEFKLGGGQMIPGFEKAVLGMKVGEKKTVSISAADAYGPRDERLVKVISAKQLPADQAPQVGQVLQATQGGSTIVVTITNISGDNITIDGNHPLAGKNLTFEVELVKIQEASK